MNFSYVFIFALLINTSWIQTNNQDSLEYTAAQLTTATLITATACFGCYTGLRLIFKGMEPQSRTHLTDWAKILKGTGTYLTTVSATQLAYNYVQCPQFLVDTTIMSDTTYHAMIGIGTGLVCIGKYLENE